MSVDLVKYIEEYVNEVFQENLNQYRFNPERVTSTFKVWADTHLGEYSGDEKVKHSTIRDLLVQLDDHYDYHFIEDSDQSLNRIKWVTREEVTGDQSDVRAVHAVVQHTMLVGEENLPTVPTATPLEAGFGASDLIEGALAYNKTLDTWYYNASGTIKELVDYTKEIPTSQVTELDFIIGGLLQSISDNAGAIEDVAFDLSELSQTLTGFIESQLALHHYEPDETTIGLDINGKLQALFPVSTAAYPLSIFEGEISLGFDPEQFEVVNDLLHFIGTTGGTVDLSDYYTKQELGSTTQGVGVHWGNITNKPELMLKNTQVSPAAQTIYGDVTIVGSITATGNITAYV